MGTSSFIIGLYGLVLMFSLCLADNIERDPEKVEDIYSDYYERKESITRPEVICNMEPTKIFDLCMDILTNITFDEGKIHFSHTAFSHLEPKCQSREVWLVKRAIHMENPENMMPCYGHANPIRTSWVRDDYFDLVWLVDGPEEDSLFIFMCRNLLSGRACVPIMLVKQKGLDNIKGFELQATEVERENELTRIMSINSNLFQINRIYIHEILKASNLCALSDDEKLTLCQQILKRNPYNHWSLRDFASETSDLECVEQTVKTPSKINPEVKRKMFLCFGSTKSVTDITENKEYFHLSSGPWHNSVIVYQEIDKVITFYELLDYINVELLLKKEDLPLVVADLFAISNNNEIFKIYDEEIIQDPICNLSSEAKYSLCEKLTEREEFGNFNWRLDKEKFVSEVQCENMSFQFREILQSDYKESSHNMFPCYGKIKSRIDTAMDEFYEKAFYVGKGPRKNSAYMYKNIGGQRYIRELMENVVAY